MVEDDVMVEDTLVSKTATSQLSQFSKPQIKDEIHSHFRLWIVTRTDVGRPLPAVLIQHGLKLACEAKGGFKETMKNTCEVVLSSIADKKGFSTVNTNTLTIQVRIYTMLVIIADHIQKRYMCLHFAGIFFMAPASTSRAEP